MTAPSEAKQAQWVSDYYLGWNTTFRAFTGPLVWFQVRDSGTNVADKWQNLGLLHRNRAAKPAYAMYQQVMASGVGVGATDLSGLVVPKLGRRVAANPKGGFYVLARDGTVSAFGGAPYLGSPRLPGGLARGITVTGDGQGYLVLDGFGGVHKYGSARAGALRRQWGPYWPGWDIARDIALDTERSGVRRARRLRRRPRRRIRTELPPRVLARLGRRTIHRVRARRPRPLPARRVRWRAHCGQRHPAADGLLAGLGHRP